MANDVRHCVGTAVASGRLASVASAMAAYRIAPPHTDWQLLAVGAHLDPLLPVDKQSLTKIALLPRGSRSWQPFLVWLTATNTIAAAA